MTPWLTKYNSPDYTLKAIKEGEKVDEDELPEAAKFEWTTLYGPSIFLPEPYKYYELILKNGYI